METDEEKMIDELRKLREDIETNCGGKDKVWFFLKEYGYDVDLKGFDGTEPIMFVALNPSKRTTQKEKAVSNNDLFFSEQLNKFDFQKAHITDLIKEKLSREEVKNFLKNNEKMEKHISFLRREIDIIKPKVIVAVGKESGEQLEKEIKDIKLFYLAHYADRFCLKHYGKIKEEVYEEGLKNIKAYYNEMCSENE